MIDKKLVLNLTRLSFPLVRFRRLYCIQFNIEVMFFSAWYQGCFVENVQSRNFNVSAGNYKVGDSSAQECTSLCAFLGFPYAGIQGDLCFCSQSYNKSAHAPSDSLCNNTCTELNACGSTSYIRVYETKETISGLNISGPGVGWLMESVEFATSVSKGRCLAIDWD